MEWIIRELVPGDHIRVKRPLYYHHGIYVGEGKVIHYSGKDGDSVERPELVEVIESDMDFFLQDGIAEVAKPSLKESLYCRSKKECVKLAKEALGRRGYNFLHNNCETLANECAYRKTLTSQIEEIKRTL